MCQKVIINRGEKEIESPNEFKQHFGFLPKDAENGELDLCMCNCDLDATFIENGIEYGICAFGDYYVGDLDKCELIHRHDPNQKQETVLATDEPKDSGDASKDIDILEALVKGTREFIKEYKQKSFQLTEREDGASTFNGVKVTHNFEIACSVDVGVEKDKQEVTKLWIEEATEVLEKERIVRENIDKVFPSFQVAAVRLGKSGSNFAEKIDEFTKSIENNYSKFQLLTELQHSRDLRKISKRKKRRNRHKMKRRKIVSSCGYVELPMCDEQVIHKLIPIVKKEFL